MIEVDYSANRSTHLPWGGFAASTRNRNYIPTNVEEQVHQRPVSDAGAEPVSSHCLSGPNAIFNEPVSRYSQPTIPLGNLLSLYPQFDGEFDGLPLLAALSRYDSMQLRFEKKAGKYVTFQGSYTLARATDNSSSGAKQLGGMARPGRPTSSGSPVLANTVSAPTTPPIAWRRLSRPTFRWAAACSWAAT